MKKYLDEARLYCEKNKYRFTKPRQQVLEIIIKQNSSLKAYDVLKLLSVEKDVKPPTIYRAIDFWSKHGFIHRVESLNSYIVCDIDHTHEGTQILVCDECGVIKEANLSNLNITKKIKEKNSFSVTKWSVEAHGICINCK